MNHKDKQIARLQYLLARALWEWSRVDFGGADIVAGWADEDGNPGFKSWDEIKAGAQNPILPASMEDLP